MTKEMEKQLRGAGYTDAQIAKEARYLARVDLENRLIRNDRAWGYGFHYAGREA